MHLVVRFSILVRFVLESLRISSIFIIGKDCVIEKREFHPDASNCCSQLMPQSDGN